MTSAEREREYSPSSCLPEGNYQPFIDAYIDRSASAWAKVERAADVITQVLPYGPTGEYTLDIAVPVVTASDERQPIVVFIHGGYWQELSSRESRFAAATCCARGWAFAAIDYPLAPHASLDEIVTACSSAIAKLRAEAAGLGVDPDRIIVTGSSAGAHLAAMAALTAPGGIAGTVLVSGVYELAPLLATSINEAVGMDVETAHRNSLLRYSVDGFPPSVMAYGSNETDSFKAQTEAFARHLEAAGTSVDCFEVADRNHFDVILDLVEPATALGDAVAALVESTESTTNATRISDGND